MPLPGQMNLHLRVPPPHPLPQLSLPGFGLLPSPPPRCPPPGPLVAPGAVWAGLSASQHTRIRQTIRRICQELLHDACFH
jgi:hypothetical protein